MLNELIKKQYNDCENYKVVDASDNKRCIICCSSNALWDYSEESFVNNVVKGDKYEWENISKNPQLNYYGRRIFIRDIQMHFYVEGINKNCSSIDGIIKLLKPLTDGYEVTVVGSSAGGYLAIIIGCILGAKRVFSFGGQVDLTSWGGGNGKNKFSDFRFLYDKKDDPKYNKWYKTYDLVKGSNCTVYQVYAKYNESDTKQANLIKDCKNACLIATKDTAHGHSFWGVVYPYLLTADDKALQKYMARHSGTVPNQFGFCVKIAGLYNTVSYLSKKALKRLRIK